MAAAEAAPLEAQAPSEPAAATAEPGLYDMAPADQTQAEPPIMQLRVHGGGFIEHMEKHGMGEDLKGLDTYILDAAPKARLSEEEMLYREVYRRRQAEKERRARIFDAKRRTIGLDKEALDAQVAEKQRRQAEEQAANKALDREMVRVEQHLKLMETEKQRAKRDMERQCREFSLEHLSTQSRRELDLNDPHLKRTSLPARVGDDDPRCGPSSGQQFNGEDLMINERKKQQQMEMRSYIEQQRFEKEMLRKQEQDEELEYYEQMTKLRDQIEEREAELKRQKQRIQHEENTKKMAEMLEQRMKEAHDLSEANRRELEHHANDPFLNEIVANGSKGTTRQQKKEVQEFQAAQRRERFQREQGERSLDKDLEFHQEQTRRQLVVMERDKQRTRRDMQHQMAAENKKLHEEQMQNKKKLDLVYRSGFGPEFFEQFGKGTR